MNNPRPRSSHSRFPLWGYAVLVVLTLLGLPWIGAESVEFTDLRDYFQGDSSAQAMILLFQRIPRVLLALAVGGTLSMTGATLQNLFRNPLAEPWTLGVAGGAAMGAFAAQAFPTLNVSFGPLNSSQALALLGAMAVLALIFSFSRRTAGVGLATQTLLLAGVTIGIVSGGVMMLVTYFISPYKFVAFHRWMMGGLDVVGYNEIGSFVILGVPGVVILLSQMREYNHLALGEDMALGHGVDVQRVQRLTFIGAGLATAACVAIAGPISFVGMIIPHIVRNLSGFDNRLVLPGSFLLGGVVLALCDAAARTVVAPTEIPVGVITAVVGGPAFLYLLVKR